MKSLFRTLAPFTAIENCVIDDSRLTRDAILVYLALARHADNETRTAFPSINTIGKVAGLDRRAVRRGVACLERCYYLYQRKRLGFTTHYTLGPRVEPDENYQTKDRTKKKKVRGRHVGRVGSNLPHPPRSN